MTYVPIAQGTEPWDAQVNAAFTDQDNRITQNAASISTLAGAPGIHIPQGWGQFWRPKRNAAATAAARVLTIGDSVTQGYFASNARTTSWVGRIRASLQTTYGNGGTGMIPSSNCGVIASSLGAPIIAAWEANNSLFTTTGPWLTGGSFIGPGVSYIGVTSAATATYKVTGTTIRMHPLGRSSTSAGWTYSIDGGAPVSVAGALVFAIQTTEVTGLSNTEHTVVISWNGGVGDTLWFCGVEGINATGVQVHNLGRTGTTAGNWTDATAGNPLWNGGSSFPGDLAIIALGINDAAASVTSDTWLSNMNIIIQRIKAANNGATDIILLNQHVGTGAGGTFYGNYSTQLLGLADTYGAALVNMWEIGNNSWDYWNSLGYWGSGTPGGGAGTSAVHPSDAGHQFIANTITPLIMS